jgi:hypothetical protein
VCDAVRRLIAGGLSDGGITVHFRGGDYIFSETVYLDENDSGTVSAPVVYTAHPGEKLILRVGFTSTGALSSP